MRRILEICSTLNDWAGRLTGMDFADERGWLSSEEQALKAQMDRDFQPRSQEAERLWHELPATDPSAVERYDARAKLALQLLEAAGGERDGFSAQSLRPRALPTCSPQRNFDFWAIWAVHQVTKSHADA
jgi:hypothetical protein